MPPVDAGIRERLLALCDAMVAHLRGLRDSKRRVSETVHETRKLGKALRGGMTLVGMPKACVRAVATVARMLAGQRDAVSRLKTWQRLNWDEGPQGQDPAVLAVGAMLEKLAHSAGRKPPAEAVGWAEARLGEARALLERHSEAALQAALPRGLRRLRKRVHQRMQRLGLRRHHAPAFHEVRKALKAWLGALELLGEAPDDTCEKLAELLGDENDLSALETWLNARGFSKGMAPGVWSRVSARHQQLRISILETALSSP
ncbi:MAG: CHAD domain-containing protein [Verrucomicrobiota bacterium]